MIVTSATQSAVHERVLLLGSDGDRSVLPVLSEAGLRAEVCEDLESLSEAVAQGAAAVVLPEELLTGEAARRIGDVLASQPRWSDLPLIVLASGGSESAWEAVAALEQAGTATVLERPLRAGALVSAVQAALRTRRRQYELRDHLAEAARQEKLLRESKERYRQLVESSPDAVAAATADGRVVWASPAAVRLLGAADATAVVGRSLLEFIDEADRQAVGLVLQRAARCGHAQAPAECRLLRADGAELRVELAVSPLPWGGAGTLHVAVRDISSRREAEERRQFLTELHDALRELEDPGEVERVASEALARRLGVTRVVFAYVDESGRWATRAGGYGEVAPMPRETFDLEEFGAETAAALRGGGLFVVEDTAKDPRTRGAVRLYRELRIGASLCAPVISRGRLVLLVTAYQAEPRAWTEADGELVEEVARRAWLAAERARAVASLRESESRFRLIADAAPVLMWVAGADGACTYYNRSWREFTGLPACEGERSSWLEAVHPDDLELAISVYRAALERREAFTVECRLRRADGAYRWTLNSGVPRRGAGNGGAFEGFVGSCVDITERRDTEDALRRSEEHFRTMADGAPVLIWMSGPDKSGVYFNKTWLDFTGRPLEEQLGGGWMKLVHPDDLDALRACTEALETRRPFRTQFRMRRADGEYRWMLDSGIPRFAPDGQFAGFIGTCADITDSKQAELTLRRSEEHFRALAESLPQIVWTAGPDGAVDYLNRRWYEFTGLSPTGPDPTCGAAAMHPDDAERAVQAWSEAVRTRRPLQSQYRVRRADGTYRWHLARAFPVLDDAGEVVKWFGTATDIDEQKQLEENLRESEERLRLAAEAARIGMWSWDVAEDRAIWTDVSKRMFGLGPDAEMTLAGFLAAVHPDDRERVREAIRESLEGRREYETEFRVVWPDGTERWIVSRGQTVRDARGRAVRMSGVVYDVTDRHKAERELRATQERLEVAQWGGRFGVFEWDMVTDRVLWTSGMERVYGVGSGGFDGTYEGWARRVEPEDVAAVREGIDAAVAESRLECQFQFRVRRPDGERRWVDCKATILYGEGGVPLRMIGINVDISDLKQAEEAVRASEERIRALADAMPQIVWSSGPDGAVDYGNRRWHELVGQEEGQISREKWLRLVHPDDQMRTLGAWEEAVRTGAPFQAEYRFLDRGTGTYRWHLDRAVPVRDESGQVTRWYGTLTDIDDQKRAQERLSEIVDELNRSNRELEDFAHIASHDLKEPLRGIRNYSSFLLEDYDHLLDAEGKRKLRTIDRLCKRMDDLISSLLYYSQVGRTQMAIVDTDLNQVVLEVLESLGPGLAERGVDVRLPKPLPVVRCDRIRVAEVYRNLITNATKYNDKPNPWVEISWIPPEHEGAPPVLYVRDNGIGIPQHHYGTVFGIFKRLHGRDDYGGGTGSGLAFVKRIIERHRGRIWVDSVEREGTTIWFTLGREEHAGQAADSHR